MTWTDAYRELVDGLRHVRYNQRTGLVSKLLNLYPDRWVSAEGMQTCDADRVLISRMLAQKYIRRVGRKRIGGWYVITSRGRFHVLCHKLNIRFLELCMLAEAHSAHIYQARDNLEPAYHVSDMMDIFDGIYSKKAIPNSSSRLCSAGFATSVSRHTLRLTGHAMKAIGENTGTVTELHCWIAGIQNSLNVMAIEDPHLLKRTISH